MNFSQWICLVVLSVLWGGAFFFVGVAVHDIPVLTLVLSRVGLAALLLVAVVLSLGLRLPTRAREWLPFAVMAVLGNIFPFSMIALGQMHIASGLAAVLNATTPLWTVLIAHALTDDDKLTINKAVGVVLGIVGVGVLMGPDAILGRTSSLFGMACVLAATASYGLAAWWARRLRTNPPLINAACQLTCATSILLPVALLAERSWLLPWPPAHVVWAVVGLAVLSTALAFILFFYIVSVSGPTNAALVTLLIPVSGILLGTVILEETLAPQHIVGAFIITISLSIFDGRLLRRKSAVSLQ